MELSLDAKVTRNPGELRVSYTSHLKAKFIVLITGGTGTGTYYPHLEVQGTTNEGDRSIYSALGASVSVNWPTTIERGSPFGREFELPNFSCTETDARCQVTFEYDVKQEISFEANIVVWIEIDPRYLRKQEDIVQTIAASMVFKGIDLVRPFNGTPQIKIELLDVVTSSEVDRAALAAR